MKKLFFLAPFLAAFFGVVGSSISQTLPNGPYDDYAPAFRRLPNGCAELWFTSVQGKVGRSRQMMVAQCSPQGFDSASPLADPNINFIDSSHTGSNAVMLNGVPSFTCDGTFGVFVSNRTVNGRDEGNDIYEMWQEGSGEWHVRRIDEVDSSSWDDTPSLSPDGTMLYFASDRRAPGSRHSELFYATRVGLHAWSHPKPIEVLDAEPGNHEAPCIGPDGYLYYANNSAGHYEIWRAPLGTNGLPTSNGSPLALAGVNLPTSDQTHPAFSPGGNWLLFTSNRADSGRTRDEDIYWACLNPDPLRVSVNVQEQIQVQESASGLVYHKQFPLATAVVDNGDQGTVTAHSDTEGHCEFALRRGINPASDECPRKEQFAVSVPSDKFVAPTGRLRYVLDTRDTILPIALQAWDTTSINDSVYHQSFPIADVQFFIEGYWGPTTYAYRNYLMRKPRASCPTFFIDTGCITLGSKEDHCESNNLYSYTYDAKPDSKTIREKNSKRSNTIHTLEYLASREEVSPCFNYVEFDTGGTHYADAVDAALDTLVSNMRIALQNPRVQLAADSNTKIHITITGFTDPKNIHTYCDYSGDSVDFSSEMVRMVDSNANPDRAIEQRFRTGEPMVHDRDDGNPLLSSLRAFWAATLLDSLWYAQIPEYARLRDRNLLDIGAIGKAVKIVKTGKDLTFAQRRSISVDITVTAEGRHVNGLRTLSEEEKDFIPQCRPPFYTLSR